ncbi:MAG: DUF4238 domain-containing protein [Pikeienuella sp.]
MNGKVPNNPPIDHHYIPVFYLKRWALTSGRLCEFKFRFSSIRPKWRFPKATGYQQYLYTMQGFPPELSQQYEQKFFSGIDDLASKSLALMEQRWTADTWTPETRSSWSRFILSVLLRQPESIERLRRVWFEQLLEDSEINRAIYEKYRREADPESYVEFASNMEITAIEQGMFKLLRNTIDNPVVGPKINDMLWRVRELPNAKNELLTSDRPVIRPSNLMRKDAHIVVPIGPRRLFIATSHSETMEQLMDLSDTQFANEANRFVVSNARRLVFAASTGQSAFIAKHFATKQRPDYMISSFD